MQNPANAAMICDRGRIILPSSELHACTETAERVQRVLACRNLSLSQVSQESAVRFGRSSRYFLPHNLYYDLRLGDFSPSIYQIFALSNISGYRVMDWLRMFHFDLESIPRMQALLPTRRTILIDSSLQDSDAFVPWVRSRKGVTPIPSTAPLSQLLEPARARRLRDMPTVHKTGSLYAKIGLQDAFAFPDLLPGSIVRVDTSQKVTTSLRYPEPIFLLAHGIRFWCSRLRLIKDKPFMTISTHAGPATEMPVPEGSRVMGTVDLEIRPLVHPVPPRGSCDTTDMWNSTLPSHDGKLSRLLRHARLTQAMSLREASAFSRRVADSLGSDQYFISSSSLSDYEAYDCAPRHFHKVITLCILYGVKLFTLLRYAGIHLEQAGYDPMPEPLFVASFPGQPKKDEAEVEAESEGEGHCDDKFLQGMLQQCGDVPFFLRHAWTTLFGLKNGSFHDVFWIGGEREARHPYLRGGLLAVVNRRRKKAIFLQSRPPWEQSLYLLLQRDGTYLSACCELQNGSLLLHSYDQQGGRTEKLLCGADTEVTGQVVAVARKLS
jgi:hypothetical protein